MENKYEYQLILMKEEIENNKQEMKAEMTDITEDTKADMKDIKETLNNFEKFMMDQTNISKSSPVKKDTYTPPDPTTVVLTTKRDPPLEGVHSTKIGGKWNLKHDISSPKFYELVIKK